MVSISFLITTILLLLGSICSGNKSKNVLLMVVDDMRVNIGAYNFSLAHTPNLDKLAHNALTFKRAFVQYAFCAPSRNSFMSGRRPDTTRVWNFQDHFREVGVGDHWRSMPEYFKSKGYVTMGSGKLYHPTVPPDNDWPKSWTTTGNHTYYSPECMPPRCNHSVAPHGQHQPDGQPNGIFHCVTTDPPNDNTSAPAGKRSTSCPANTTADEERFEYQLEDQRIRDSCTNQLERVSKDLQNDEDLPGFFVGCGFHKPHVPWQFPKEFLKNYPKDLQDIPLAEDTYAPTNMPKVAWHMPADVHGFNIKFNGTCNKTRARNFRRSYYAAISYQDYNIGLVLKKLDELHLTNSTIVAVIGDHGWQLGEHDTWAKMTNFEVALRIPMIIRVPWMTSSIGKVTNVLAEAVDLYPTLAVLADLTNPLMDGEGINGTSLVPVFVAPEKTHATLKDAAYSQFAKPSIKNPFEFWPTPARNKTEIMGYTVRTNEWRYTCWFGFDSVKIVPMTHDILGRELYDHREDTSDEIDWKGEHFNLVDDPKYALVVKTLHIKILNYIQLRPVEIAVVKKSVEKFRQVTTVCSTCEPAKDGLRVEYATLATITTSATSDAVEDCANACLNVPNNKCISFAQLASGDDCQLYQFSEQYTVVSDSQSSYQYYLRLDIPTVAPLSVPSKNVVPPQLKAPTSNVVLGSQTVFAQSMDISIDYLLRHYQPKNMLYWFRHRANLSQPPGGAFSLPDFGQRYIYVYVLLLIFYINTTDLKKH